MAKFELKLPKTVTTWLKEVGDTIELDDAVVEIATDKVDSEVPSEVEGVLVEKLFEVDEVVQVGQTIAIIDTEGENVDDSAESGTQEELHKVPKEAAIIETQIAETAEVVSGKGTDFSGASKFYSPLVKNIATSEGVTLAELESIPGTGKDGRVTKNDILQFVESRSNGVVKPVAEPVKKEVEEAVSIPKPVQKEAATAPVVASGNDEIIEMTRMGKLIAHHMVESVQTSAHVQSFIEADVTNIWNWRNKVKADFMNREFLWRQ